jgi:hypothetical protein
MIAAQRNFQLARPHSGANNPHPGTNKRSRRKPPFLLDTPLSSSPVLANSTRHSVTSRIQRNPRFLSYLIFSTRHLNATLEKRNFVEKFNTFFAHGSFDLEPRALVEPRAIDPLENAPGPNARPEICPKRVAHAPGTKSRLRTGPSALRLGPRKLHLGHFTRRLGGREVGVVAMEARPARENVIGKLANERVVGLQRIVVALALDGDAILGAGKLVLQAQEILIGLELRIILDN